MNRGADPHGSWRQGLGSPRESAQVKTQVKNQVSETDRWRHGIPARVP